jgi:integrase
MPMQRPHSAPIIGCSGENASRGRDTRSIQDWLGHVSITPTTRYTALSPARFKDFWRD